MTRGEGGEEKEGNQEKAGEEKTGELRKEETNAALNLSALNDINMSRAEEHPLIIDLGRSPDKDIDFMKVDKHASSKFQGTPSAEKRVWNDKYMRKGSRLGTSMRNSSRGCE